MKYLPISMLLATLVSCGTNQTENTSSTKSNYPSDYPFRQECQEQGIIKVCRSLQGSGAIAIDVDYTGSMRHEANLKAFVKVNYLESARSNLFVMSPASSYNNDRHVRVTNGCLVGQLGGCAQGGTDDMKYLLQWAGRMPMTANALDIEFAFTNDAGQWDSRDGGNYVFHFGESRPW